jgi:hypothetical protein
MAAIKMSSCLAVSISHRRFLGKASSLEIDLSCSAPMTCRLVNFELNVNVKPENYDYTAKISGRYECAVRIPR